MQGKVEIDIKNQLINFIQNNKHPIKQDDEFIHNLLAGNCGINSAVVYLDPPSPIKKINLFFFEVKGIVNIIVTITENKSGFEKYFYRIDPTFFERLMSLLNKAKILVDSAFERPRKKAFSIERWNNLSPYNNETHKTYALIREVMAKQARRCVEEQNKTEKPIFLLDIGTGFGDCLDVTVSALQDKYRIDTALGIDKNSVNIVNAKKRFSSYQFEENDINALENIFAKYKKKDCFILITSSGSLTRLVLNNTLEAINAVQQTYRFADVLLLAGLTEVLVTQKIVKNIGWHVQLNAVEEGGRPIYTLSHAKTPLPKIKNNFLNLSLHADPLSILTHYCGEHLVTITSIDLGLAYLKSEEIDSLLIKLPSLEKIFLSGEEFWYQALLAKKPTQITLVTNRSDYIDDALENREQWEIKKHSRKFFALVQTNFKSIYSLISQMESNKEKYDCKDHTNGNFLSNFGKSDLNNYINRLKVLADKGDDVAIYALAIKLQFGIHWMGIDPVTGYAIGRPYQSRVDSLTYWKLLLEKGYQVEKNIEQLKNEMSNFERMQIEPEESIPRTSFRVGQPGF